MAIAIGNTSSLTFDIDGRAYEGAAIDVNGNVINISNVDRNNTDYVMGVDDAELDGEQEAVSVVDANGNVVTTIAASTTSPFNAFVSGLTTSNNNLLAVENEERIKKLSKRIEKLEALLKRYTEKEDQYYKKIEKEGQRHSAIEDLEIE